MVAGTAVAATDCLIVNCTLKLSAIIFVYINLWSVNKNLATNWNKPIVGTDAHIGPQNLMRFKRSDVGIAPYTESINLFDKLSFDTFLFIML